jgi:hypothetical protein
MVVATAALAESLGSGTLAVTIFPRRRLGSSVTDLPTHRNDPLAALFDRKSARWRVFPVPEARVMFVQVNKNACTSLKWMMAGIAGEDLRGFGPSLQPGAADEDDIHDRRQWRKVPRLDQIDPEVRAQIHPSNDWFIFAVTRDPRARLFSAWQSKLLLENPGYTSFQREPWYPRHPVTTDSVVEDFARFVDLLVREPGHRIRGDGHFRDQVELLHEDVVTYTDIYDVRDLGRLQTDLRQHLDRLGWRGELTLPRLNDTPLRANALPFANGLDAQVQKLYGADFARFGDRWDFSTIESNPAWTDADLAQVEARASLGRRFGYLRNQAITFRTEAHTERRRANAEAKRADAQTRRADRLKERLRQRATPPPPRHGRLRSMLDLVLGVMRRCLRRI